MSQPTDRNTKKSFSAYGRPALLAGLLLCAGFVGLKLSPSAAEGGRAIPAPVMNEPAGQAASETAIFAGGCFWGVQGVFQHVEGVTNAVSGYAGGEAKTAQYELVSDGNTGHAESVKVTFDPQKISYGQLLQIFFSVAHDPTELNRQGPDVGTQYRSAIFPTSAAQADTTKSYISQLDKARVFDAAIVTKIEMDKAFFPAEAYHQDFLVNNPCYPYIVINDLPKIDDLKRLFPEVYRGKPALVAEAKVN
jgi:peptide-methionine (S)-S-oxide reductase